MKKAKVKKVKKAYAICAPPPPTRGDFIDPWPQPYNTCKINCRTTCRGAGGICVLQEHFIICVLYNLCTSYFVYFIIRVLNNLRTSLFFSFMMLFNFYSYLGFISSFCSYHSRTPKNTDISGIFDFKIQNCSGICVFLGQKTQNRFSKSINL